MTTSHAAVLEDWFTQVWNQGNTEAVHRLLAADGVMHGLGEPDLDARGPAGFLPFFHDFRRLASDIHFTVHDVVESGEKVAARWSVRLRPIVNAEPGPPIELTGMSFVRIRNGQLIEGWNNWDARTFIEQFHPPTATIALMRPD